MHVDRRSPVEYLAANLDNLRNTGNHKEIVPGAQRAMAKARPSTAGSAARMSASVVAK